MSDTQRRSDCPSASAVPPEIAGAPKIGVPPTGHGEIVSSGTPQLDDAHRSFAEFHQGYVSGYIEFADTKAAWVFAIAAGLLAYVFGKDDLQELMFLPDWSVPFVLLVSTVLVLLLSVVFSFLVISPRLATSGEAIVFFSAVAKKPSADSYIKEIASMSDSALTEARLKHSYDISLVCARKYGHLRWAFWTGALGLIGMAGLSLAI